MLRFSMHLYNNESDVDRVLDLVREWQGGKGRA
jgi:selenocysteine lyase/cysteine desulfurase